MGDLPDAKTSLSMHNFCHALSNGLFICTWYKIGYHKSYTNQFTSHQISEWCSPRHSHVTHNGQSIEKQITHRAKSLAEHKSHACQTSRLRIKSRPVPKQLAKNHIIDWSNLPTVGIALSNLLSATSLGVISRWAT
ncbi:Uncharacterized protein TCM_044177 [Theobroma cacao]|uniref:Uncharacterized protein n=1 Tax=Theobroma cacao TaxID=3641 RepID=A0A061FWR0_THECC|nr:Uncharacterized protein TCM_044177 [Theobroma cacao]